MAEYTSGYLGSQRGSQRARRAVKHQLDSVESGVDTVIDGANEAAHELRGKAREMADAILDRVTRSWEDQRPRVEAYMNAHPWLVLGGLILLAYMLSGINGRLERSGMRND